jgi:hypothetical protein
MKEKIRVQDPMDFTVEVVSRSLSGTGFLVSTDGRLITCAHVINDAIAEKAEVDIIFHERKGRKTERRRARIVAVFPNNDDDVALLQLIDGPLPLRPEEIAYLGSAEETRGHKFQTFGYSQIEGEDATYQGIPADGYIKGHGNKPEKKNLIGSPLWLSSNDIKSGMSGAAVLDVDIGDDGNPINRVVGVIEQGEMNPALAVDASVLKHDPFNLNFAGDTVPLLEPPHPKTDLTAVEDKIASQPGIAWNNAPPILEEWVPRKDLLKDLTDCWVDAERRITIIGLIGLDGGGKTSLARQWAADLLRDRSRPDGIFWWSFSEKPSVDEFFEAALRYVSKGQIDPGEYPSANIRAQIIGAMLVSRQ